MPFATEYWDKAESSVRFVPSTDIPNLPLTTVVMVAAQDDHILMTYNPRGWDYPGGHIEVGESPLQAIVREVAEETAGVIGHIRQIGYLEVTKHKNNALNQKYPPIGGIIVYTGTDILLEEVYDLSAFESTDRRMVPLKEIPAHHHNWTDMKRQVTEYAISQLKELINN